MNIKQKQGFTIIEVVLVLAIAGLIFLVVFLALPALQRSQRDTQRRNDVGRALTAVQQYQSNTRGALPTVTAAYMTGGTFTTQYLTNDNSSFDDPSTGSTYTFVNGGAGAGAYPTPAQGQMSYRTSAKCGAGAFTAAGARSIALVVTLETGGSYCQSN